jgi:hypothetical protein
MTDTVALRNLLAQSRILLSAHQRLAFMYLAGHGLPVSIRFPATVFGSTL